MFIGLQATWSAGRDIIWDVIREWFDPDALRRVGSTPDYRFSLANERTFLAWVRTGLALIAGGLAIAQFLPELRVPYLREALAISLLALGGAVALRALNHWVRVERAMRLGEDLPQSRFPATLAIAVGLGAVLLAAVVVVEGVTG
jgi:putative membrane protein